MEAPLVQSPTRLEEVIPEKLPFPTPVADAAEVITDETSSGIAAGRDFVITPAIRALLISVAPAVIAVQQRTSAGVPAAPASSPTIIPAKTGSTDPLPTSIQS